ncbi:MAG: DUF1697 domain-containing protein [Gemmatimonadota bacterium]|nr:DUF1697 domain-containing protein [Gemmatimonadota bacterium]
MGADAPSSTWILLLRGINVGGRNRLGMDDLKEILTSLGLENIRTWIQSGNVVFESGGEVSPDLADEIAEAIEEDHGFRPRVLLLSAEELEEAIEANPFPEAESEPKRLHLFFLESVPEEPDLEELAEAKAPTERYHLTDRVFYLHAPEGIGRSKLAGNAERYLGVRATARNWRTVQAVRDMVS